MPPKPLLRTYSDLRALRDPVFLGAFAGRNGGSAAAAVQYLVDRWEASPVAEIDPEESFDFTVRRPLVRLENGVRIVNWPKNQFFVARPSAGGRDFVLMPGIEPHIRWRAFCEAITEVLLMTGTRTAVILGSRTAALPHTRPVPFRLVAADPAFARLFETEPVTPNYEGPTGITTVLGQRLGEAAIDTAALTALTPFYVQSEPNPNAVIAMVRAIDRAFGTTTELTILLERALEVNRATEEAAAQASELRTAITSLEQQYDRERGGGATITTDEDDPGLPSGREAVEDLEAFLRELRGDGPEPPER